MRACVDRAGAVLARGIATAVRAIALAPALALKVALGLVPGMAPVAAHEVPGELRIHAFVKPEADAVHVLLRVPLELLANLDLPRRADGLVDLSRADARLPVATRALVRDVLLFDRARQLEPARTAARFAPQGDRSFGDFDAARAAVTGPPLAATEDVAADRGYLDAYFVYPLHDAAAQLAFESRLSPGLADRLKLDIRFVGAQGAVHAFELPAGAPRLELDPRWWQAAWTFVQGGFWHILDGVDHLLFLLCLVLPFRRIGGALIGVVTAFTVAHSITLIAAAYGVVPGGAWFAPLIEVLIAASIVYMAVENVLHPDLRRRWAITFLFGLVHGFGFSFLLRSQLQFAGSHLLSSLLAFNVGIELGQLLVLALVLPLLTLVLARLPRWEGAVMMALSVGIGAVALVWLVQRLGALGEAGAPQAVAWLAVLGVAVLGATLVRSRRRGRLGITAPR